jgi:hypothetical protein
MTDEGLAALGARGLRESHLHLLRAAAVDGLPPVMNGTSLQSGGMPYDVYAAIDLIDMGWLDGVVTNRKNDAPQVNSPRISTFGRTQLAAIERSLTPRPWWRPSPKLVEAVGWIVVGAVVATVLDRWLGD